MRTYYVIRSGWNAANQSAQYRPAKPKNRFQSGELQLVAIVQAASEDAAIEQCPEVTCYNNQCLYATTNSRRWAGLSAEIAEWQSR